MAVESDDDEDEDSTRLILLFLYKSVCVCISVLNLSSSWVCTVSCQTERHKNSAVDSSPNQHGCCYRCYFRCHCTVVQLKLLPLQDDHLW